MQISVVCALLLVFYGSTDGVVQFKQLDNYQVLYEGNNILGHSDTDIEQCRCLCSNVPSCTSAFTPWVNESAGCTAGCGLCGKLTKTREFRGRGKHNSLLTMTEPCGGEDEEVCLPPNPSCCFGTDILRNGVNVCSLTDCSDIGQVDLVDTELFVKECSGKEILESDHPFKPDMGFNESEFNKLFGNVKTLRMKVWISESDIVNMVMPELTSIEEPATYIYVYENHKLLDISFPQLTEFPEHLELEVVGNRLLSNESAQKLKDMSIGIRSTKIMGFGDCTFWRDDGVRAASELNGCKTISSGLKIASDFSGSTNAVITRVDGCITIVNTTIEDISFLKLNASGVEWNECEGHAITIKNNPKLCTLDFEELIEKLDPKPFTNIENNKDKAACENERKQKKLELLEASMTTEPNTIAITMTAAPTTAPEVNSSPHQHRFEQQQELELLEASKTTEPNTIATTTTAATTIAPELNSSPYQHLFAALCFVAAATILSVL